MRLPLRCSNHAAVSMSLPPKAATTPLAGKGFPAPAINPLELRKILYHRHDLDTEPIHRRPIPHYRIETPERGELIEHEQHRHPAGAFALITACSAEVTTRRSQRP